MAPGRSCPVGYRYRPEQLGQGPELWPEDVLYVAGGLYGNPYALDAIEAMAAAERAAGRSVRLLFNGDFNWFNSSDELFRSINHRVLKHDAMLGNVEYELAYPSEGTGCGCAYPDFVDDGVVERSNRIMARLQEQAARCPEIHQHLGDLPRWRCGIFGGLKVLVVHGDLSSLAGWGLSREALLSGATTATEDGLHRSGADLVLCSHTCLPLMWSGVVDGHPRVVVNNGSAGMANLRHNHRGLVARISTTEPLSEPVAQMRQGGLSLSLMAVDFDLTPWLERFDGLWPTGSDAALSYRSRIQSGTSLTPSELII